MAAGADKFYPAGLGETFGYFKVGRCQLPVWLKT